MGPCVPQVRGYAIPWANEEKTLRCHIRRFADWGLPGRVQNHEAAARGRRVWPPRIATSRQRQRQRRSVRQTRGSDSTGVLAVIPGHSGRRGGGTDSGNSHGCEPRELVAFAGRQRRQPLFFTYPDQLRKRQPSPGCLDLSFQGRNRQYPVHPGNRRGRHVRAHGG